MLDEDGVFDGKSRSDGDIVWDGDEGRRLNDSFFDYYDLILEEGGSSLDWLVIDWFIQLWFIYRFIKY